MTLKKTSFGGPAQFLGAYQTAVDGPPETVLVVRNEEFPFISKYGFDQIKCDQELRNRTEIACLSLLMFGTRHPIIDVSWHEYDDHHLNYLVHGKRRFWRMPEVIPLRVAQHDVDIESLTNLHQHFLEKLNEQRRSKCVRSMKRFELSLARHDKGNAVTDLCIALEQALGERKETPISWTHGLRTALLLGQTPQERRTIRDTFETLYRMRNRFVHGGQVDDYIDTKTRGRIPAVDLLEDARQLYCRIISALVSAERDPDWSELETNGARHG